MTEWFQRWFGEEYLRLYPHRNDEDARQAVDLLAAHVPLAKRRVLDLACGPGRHSATLAGRGASVVGYDLSRVLLRRARDLRVPGTRFVRGDIRTLPFRSGAFDVTVNLFTSFGYFDDDAEHSQVLREAARTLAPGGFFVLDYFHAASVRRSLVPREEQQVGLERVVIERRISEDNRFVIKDLRLLNEGRAFEERVRLFGPLDLERLLGDAGFRIHHAFGAYDGRALDDNAPRAIFIAQRS
ncbi:MAG: class I SAM-dependent methyltransferase [Gemmatimonadetes bacterium]|nr:class I SAM-dependent methyltransferase [Gemmatimonadota bacterium]